MTGYNLMLALSSAVDLDAWIAFALRLLPDNGEIHLRGMVSVPPDKSLSEGALPAREWRDAFRALALAHPAIHDEVEVHVDYQPFQRILQEVGTRAFDLLLVEWRAFSDEIGGVPLAEALALTTCDVALVIGVEAPRAAHNVLLSLRGGPNLSLGTRVAAALAGQGAVTLFHAVESGRSAPDLETVMRAAPQIRRTVTAVSGIIDGIVRELASHDLIVMGAGFRRLGQSGSQADVFHEVHERTQKPIVLVHAARQEPLTFHAPRLLLQRDEPLSVRVDRWFAENTFHSSEFDDLDQLLALKEKQGVSISVALPALNEEATVEQVIMTVKTALMDRVPLVDEIVLIDSRSSDRTVEIAQACGIPTYIHQEILSGEVGSFPGKGEALWKSLYVTQGDIIAWIDTDITNIHPRFIYGLLGPLLKRPRLQYVKGFYTRPIEVGGKLQAYGGGRVTELVARPLFNLFYPELSGVVQPLSGEYAGRRSALEQVPFYSGYGVETGLLIDLLARFDLESIAQSDLEVRVHHNQPLVNLSKMSFAILQVFLARLEARYGAEVMRHANRSMKLVIQEQDRFALDIAEIGDQERPPMIDVPAYRQRR
jgi:glucosyl-3-phosphoglycerate synthase